MNPNNISPDNPIPTLNQPNVTRQKGSFRGMVFIVVLLATLVLGSLAGFFGGAASQKNSSQKSIDQLQAQYDQLKKETDVKSIATGPDVAHFSYLNISEWKIRMPLNDKYTDVVYRIKTELGTSYVEITSATLAKISTCVNYDGQIGTITRAKSGTTPEPAKQVTGFNGQIYMFKQFDQTCTSNSKEVEAPYKASILEQFARLEPMPTKQIKAD